jgi:hypothetical protein
MADILCGHVIDIRPVNVDPDRAHHRSGCLCIIVVQMSQVRRVYPGPSTSLQNLAEG